MKYVFLTSEEASSVVFDQVEETSHDTLRWNISNTQTFVRYSGVKPRFLYGKTALSEAEFFAIMNDPEQNWKPPLESEI